MAKLTEAGFAMIRRYLDHVELAERVPAIRDASTGRDGRLFLRLAPNSGPQAATIRKLVRDGFAEGCYSWCGDNRWMIPTETGLVAYWEERMQRKHEDDLRRAFG